VLVNGVRDTVPLGEMGTPPARDPRTQPAWDLYVEIVDLQEQGVAANHAGVIARAQEAVRIAPHEPDLLMLIAVALYPYHATDKAAKALMIDCQVELDRLGGPSDFALAESGGIEAYAKRRNLIASKAGRKLREASVKKLAAERDEPRLAAGWYDDPRGEARLRYWDGQTWTEHTAR
jgi:hypothetical protein